MSIADKLTTIAENEPKVYKAGQIAMLKNSKYMNANEIGAIISANDVSPIEHSLGVKVGSKNLFDIDNLDFDLGFCNMGGSVYPFSKYTEGTKTNTSITINQKSVDASAYIYLAKLKANTTITLSYESEENRDLFFVDDVCGNHTTFVRHSSVDKKVTATIPFDGYAYMHFSTPPQANYERVISNIQLELGTTATAYTPYITDFSSVKVTRCGKNLFDADKASVRSNWVTHNGGYFTFKVFVGKGNTFTVSYQQDLVTGLACPYTQIVCDLSNIDKNGCWIYHTANSGLINKKWTYTAIEDYIYVRSNIPTESALANFMQYIGNDLQVEIGATATEYEPYKQPQTVIANADGTVEGLTSLSPNMTLYTDNDGAIINCQYYRDIDTYIDNLLINLAMTGGV